MNPGEGRGGEGGWWEVCVCGGGRGGRTQTGVDEMVSGVKGDRCFDG